MTRSSPLLLTIGMPVFNGEPYLARALDSLIRQDCEQWILFIADNQSTDATREIAECYAAMDSRISYCRHEKNLGAVNNFLFLAGQAVTPYFMWAAADDEWSSNYVSSCIGALELDCGIGFAGGGICNTDPTGTSVRNYKAFSGFDAYTNSDRIGRYVVEIEANGKANMIYSVFRTELLQTLCHIPRILEGWGSDMAFVLAALSRARYIHIPQATLYKRVVSEEDIRTAKLLNAGRYGDVEFGGNFPLSHFASYLGALMRGMPSLYLRMLVMRIMLGRFIRLSMQSPGRRWL